MKKAALVVFFLIFCPANQAFCADVAGIRPQAPNGVFTTFGAYTVEKLRSAFSLSLQVVEEPSFFRVIPQVTLGISQNMEISTAMSYNTTGADGFEDLALSFKHRFVDEGKYGPSIAYMLTGALPTGSSSLTTDGRYGGGIIITKRMGPVLAHANLFYIQAGATGSDPDVSFSVGAEFSASHNFRLLADVTGRKTHFSGKINQIDLNVGCRYAAVRDFYTTMAVGTDLNDSSSDYRMLLTFTAYLPSIEAGINRIFEQGD